MTDESPTTAHGPLHTPEADLEDRLIRATYATPGEADNARNRLVQAGIAADRIRVIADAADSAGVRSALQPKDKGVVARVREALVPDDSNSATLKAARHHEAILELRPNRDEVEQAVGIIEASDPSHFDAGLERWRNAG